MYFGMPPDPTLCAGMVITDLEYYRLRKEELIGRSYLGQDGLYHCVKNTTGPNKQLGAFKTVAECNQAYLDDVKPAKVRQPALLGYTSREREDGSIRYQSLIFHNKKNSFIGSFDTAKEARARHVEAIDQINAGTFEGWLKRLKKTSKN